MTLKIVVINPFGAGSVYSGPVVLMQRLFGALSSSHEITVLYGSRNSSDMGIPWAVSSFRVMRFRGYGALEQIVWSIRVTDWLLRNAHRYDVVHFHGSAFFNLLPALGALIRKRQYVLVALAARGDLSRDAKIAGLPFLRALRRLFVSKATIGFALSDDIAAEFIALGLHPTRVVPLMNPVDTALYAPPEEADEGRACKRSLGFIGMLCPRKRPDLVLEVLASLRRRGFPDAGAILVGPFETSAYETVLRRRVRELDLDTAVELVGYTTEVERLLSQEIGVLVHPSSKEGLPGALVEAMASGLPAVVTDVGAMGAVITAAGAGYVVEPDSEVIADAIEGIWKTEGLWEELSRRARRYAVAHFDVSVVSGTYVCTLGRLCRQTMSDFGAVGYGRM